MTKKKLLGILITILLLTIVFSGCFEEEKEVGKTIVIQELIDAASPGDTIIIPSGIYYENILINKSINISGQSKETTIIDGSKSDYPVVRITNKVNISGFTIRNGFIGIYLSSDDIVTDNLIINNSLAGIESYCMNCTYPGHNNLITRNTIINSNKGIYLADSHNNTIFENDILDNNYGIYLGYSYNNKIYLNDLKNNTENAYDNGNNTWYDTTLYSELGNYWSDYVEKYPNAFQVNNYYVGLLWGTPYNITGGNNQDRYPLFSPFEI